MKVGKVLVVALLVGWSATTATQVYRWGNPLALWQQAIRVAPLKPRPWNNLGAQYVIRGQEPFAIQAFQTATRLAQHPRRSAMERAAGISVAQTNLALLEAQHGEFDRALARLAPVRNLYQFSEAIAAYEWISRQHTLTKQTTPGSR